MVNHPNRVKLVYGNILPAAGRITPTYWREVVLDAEASRAISEFYCGDDRAAGLRKVFVRTARDALHLERVALALTGRLSAVKDV